MTGHLPLELQFCFDEKVRPDCAVLFGVACAQPQLVCSMFFDELLAASALLQTNLPAGQPLKAGLFAQPRACKPPPLITSH